MSGSDGHFIRDCHCPRRCWCSVGGGRPGRGLLSPSPLPVSHLSRHCPSPAGKATLLAAVTSGDLRGRGVWFWAEGLRVGFVPGGRAEPQCSLGRVGVSGALWARPPLEAWRGCIPKAGVTCCRTRWPLVNGGAWTRATGLCPPWGRGEHSREAPVSAVGVSGRMFLVALQGSAGRVLQGGWWTCVPVGLGRPLAVSSGRLFLALRRLPLSGPHATREESTFVPAHVLGSRCLVSLRSFVHLWTVAVARGTWCAEWLSVPRKLP